MPLVEVSCILQGKDAHKENVCKSNLVVPSREKMPLVEVSCILQGKDAHQEVVCKSNVAVPHYIGLFGH